jgi:hypothetical protein
MRSGSECRRLTPTAKRMIFDTRGATAAIFAISLPVLVGMGALAVDVGLWSVQKRHAQGAADQAAFSAAIAGTTTTDEAAELEGKAVTASMGLVDGEGGVEVAVNKLASFDGESGDFWEVIVEQPQPMWFAAMFLGDAPTARARAVAGTASGGAACIIGLATSGVSVDVGNNSVSNSGCGVYANSILVMKNNSAINGAAFVAGSIDKQNPSQIDIGREVVGVSPTPDPYADVPSPASCSGNASITNGGNYSPGQFCNGIDIRNNASNKTLNLSPGTYVIGNKFDLSNGVTINGTGGVTLVFRPGTTVSLGNNLVFNITAPTSGAYAGIAMMGRNMGTNILAWNNGTFNIQGALYFPNQELSIKNNFNAAKCTQLVALRVSINNNADMYDECPGSGIRDIGNGKVALLG